MTAKNEQSSFPARPEPLGTEAHPRSRADERAFGSRHVCRLEIRSGSGHRLYSLLTSFWVLTVCGKVRSCFYLSGHIFSWVEDNTGTLDSAGPPPPPPPSPVPEVHGGVEGQSFITTV